MIVRFPFLADSRKTIRFPFYADSIPDWQVITPDEIGMVVRTYDDVYIWPRIYALPNEIGMVLKAENSLEIKNISTSIDLYESAMYILCNKLETNIATSVLNDGDGNLTLAIKADETDANILIDATRTALFQSWLQIAASGGIEISQEIKPLIEECNAYLRAHDDVDVGPITRHIDEPLKAFMMLADSRYSKKIDEVDPLANGIIDLLNIDDLDYIKELADLNLEIGLLSGEDGNIRLVLRAVDDLEIVRGTPVTLGMIDPKKISELDGSVIPDYTYL